MESLIHLLDSGSAPVAIFLVAFAGAMEYLFPPFPGDTMMLFGFFLAGRGDLPVSGVFTAAMAGSLLGVEVAYRIGAGTGRSYFFLRRSRFAAMTLPALERYFNRFGAPILLVNRFLPVLRGFFLYAAGMGQMARGATFVFANLSNLAWILLIAWAGHRFGTSWEQIQSVFKTYTWIIGAIFLVYLVLTLFRYRLSRRLATPA